MEQYSPRGFKVLPDVVKNLLIINALFFLATIAFETAFKIDLIDILGLHLPTSEKFKIYQFVTYMFMHGSFGHLFFNMFAVWMFGYVLENFWGGKRFLIYYLVTGFGAALIHYAIVYYQMYPTLQAVQHFLDKPSEVALFQFLNSDNFQIVSSESDTHFRSFQALYSQLHDVDPSKALAASVNFMGQYKMDLLNAPNVVGASGAVFGILLAFGMMFPNTLLYVYFAIPIKAKYFVIIYGAIELFSGISNRPGDNVAHFAHLGGMLFGFILIRLWGRRRYN